MSRFTRRNVTIEFEDGAGNKMTFGPGPGDFNLNNMMENNAEVLEARDRHAHDGLFYGDDVVQEFSITQELRNETRTDAAVDRVHDWIHKTGKVAAYTSVDACAWSFMVRVIESDGVTTVTTLLPKVRASEGFAEAKEGNTLAISGTNYLAPVIT